MIAARLAGGNLFLPFLGGGGFWVGDFGSTRSTRSTRIFFEGILWWGFLGALGALGFFEGIFLWGDSFFWVVGCVLDCKCWKKLKND